MRHLPTTLTAMSSHILFSKDRWGPEALGWAGALRGQGQGGRAPVAPLPPPSPSGVNLPPQFMPVLGVPPGLRGSASGRARQHPEGAAAAPGSHCAGGCPAEPGGGGGCDHSGTQTPDIPFWGCRREAKRNVKRCLKARRKPVGLSRSSICGKKPWHGAAGSTAKIDRGAEKRLNSGSNVPPQRKSRSREWERPRPSLQLPSGPQHQRGRES